MGAALCGGGPSARSHGGGWGSLVTGWTLGAVLVGLLGHGAVTRWPVVPPIALQCDALTVFPSLSPADAPLSTGLSDTFAKALRRPQTSPATPPPRRWRRRGAPRARPDGCTPRGRRCARRARSARGGAVGAGESSGGGGGERAAGAAAVGVWLPPSLGLCFYFLVPPSGAGVVPRPAGRQSSGSV